jgi:hypothetical protein
MLENEIVIFEDYCVWNGPWMTIRRIPKKFPIYLFEFLVTGILHH